LANENNMTIEERLQLVVGFVKNNTTSTQTELVDFLVSQGDTQTEAENAIPLYIGMLVSFGYIINATYEDMRDWGNTVSVEALSNASTTLLGEYYKQVTIAEQKIKDTETISEYNNQILKLEEEKKNRTTLNYPTGASADLKEAIDDFNLKIEHERTEIDLQITDIENKKQIILN